MSQLLVNGEILYVLLVGIYLREIAVAGTFVQSLSLSLALFGLEVCVGGEIYTLVVVDFTFISVLEFLAAIKIQHTFGDTIFQLQYGMPCMLKIELKIRIQ